MNAPNTNLITLIQLLAGGRNLVLETIQDRSTEEQKQLTHAWAHGLAYAIHKAKGFRILVV